MSTNENKLNIPIQINGGNIQPKSLLERELYIDTRGRLFFGDTDGTPKTLSRFGLEDTPVCIVNDADKRFIRIQNVGFYYNDTDDKKGLKIRMTGDDLDCVDYKDHPNPIVQDFTLEKCPYKYGNLEINENSIVSPNIEVGKLLGKNTHTYGYSLPGTGERGQIFFLIKK